MTAPVVVLVGPARSGKTHELLSRYRDALRAPLSENLDRVLWIAPNGRTARLVRRRLVEGLDACLRPNIFTFDELAGVVLGESTHVRSISGVAKRELLRRVVHRSLKENQLKFFARSALNAGFIGLLAEHVGELKRRDIRPRVYAKASESRASAQQHQELAQLYADYEQLLTKHQLCDAESAMWAARDVLAADKCGRFRKLDLIVVDGFTDFTRAQQGVLHELARRSRELYLSLPADSAPAPAQTGRLSDQSVGGGSSGGKVDSRAGLFAKTAVTLAELRGRYPTLAVRELAARGGENLAIDFAVQHVFRHPNTLPQLPAEVLKSLDGLEIIATAGAQDEVVQIARRIKMLLCGGGARPDDIVVVFRSLGNVAPRIREVFDQFGIPYSMESSVRLVATPVVKTLLSLLRLDADNWPFRRVVSVITNNTLSAIDDNARQSADWLVRELQVAEGRDALLEKVEQLASESGASIERSKYAQRRIDRAALALPVLQLLATAVGQLPEEATLTEWCDALSLLGSELRLSPFSATSEGRTGRFREQLGAAEVNASPKCAEDTLAWQRIVAHFAALERLNTWVGEAHRKLSQRELLATLIDVAANESLPPAHDDVGRVRVLSAPSARTVAARQLFLAGMSEQAFPSPEQAGRLATDSDYRFLSRAADQDGIAASTSAPSSTRSQDEMLLFYEVLGRAEESLTISYPALDDKAQELPPSPYVSEVERIYDSNANKQLRRSTPELSPVSKEPACSLADWRAIAVATAIAKDGNANPLADLFACDAVRATGKSIDAAIRIVHGRARRDAFGPAEGLLTTPAAAARLAQRFGPQHLWSPSQWETYASCPYRFFMEDVLGLEPLADLVLETDFSRRGSRLHDVLATFHHQWLGVRGDRATNADEEAADFCQYLRKVIDDRMANPSRGGIDAALLELDRRQILNWADGHFDHHQKYGGYCGKRGTAMTPAHFEFRFGPARPGNELRDAASSNAAYVIEVGGERVRITGQIDRIDVGTIDGTTVFNVIDYKSGRKTSFKDEHIETGERLQLPIYVEAAQSLVFGGKAEPLSAGYWSMGSGYDSRGALAVLHDAENGDRWQQVRNTVREVIGQFIGEIRHGDFPVDSRDDKCTSYCDFRTVCRVGHVRSLGKSSRGTPGEPLARG